MNRILARLSRRAGTALTVSTLALGLTTAACSTEAASTSDAAAPATASAASSTATAAADPAADPEPRQVDGPVPTSAAGVAFAAGGGATTNCPTNTNGGTWAGVWRAADPDGYIASITIALTDCDSLNSARFRVVSHKWAGLGPGYSDWGTAKAKNVSWGYVGTSVTVTYRFSSGLKEVLHLVPPNRYVGLTTDGHETWTNGDSRDLEKQYYTR